MDPTFFVPLFLIGALGGYVLALRQRIAKTEAELAAFRKQLEPKPEAEGSYREAPVLPSAFSALVGATQELIQQRPEPKPETKPAPTRPLLDHRGGVVKCPVCDGYSVTDPTYLQNGCDDATCGRPDPHLHQSCRCGAIWASRTKA